MPLAGIAWQAMQYILGFRRLGFECWYIEDHGANPYDPRENSVSMSCSYNVSFLEQAMRSFGMENRWYYWDAIKDIDYGMTKARTRKLYQTCDLLINLCGATRLRSEHMASPIRIMIDTDPVYEQIRYAQADPVARAYLDAHTHFFTYGENVGGPGWIVPLCGINWKPTRPPVVLGQWRVSPQNSGPWTTIATWENKGKNIDFAGERYVWSKHVNFVKFLDLPKRTGEKFLMAMLPPDKRVERQVRESGWQLTDPRPVSGSMEAYAEFIRNSRGEFTVAKDIYARTNSGWFSDRSVCYLASGRPVVTMNTGFSRFYPASKGLIDFTSVPEAEAGIREVASDYERHSRAAREVAECYFSSDSVLTRLLADVGF